MGNKELWLKTFNENYNGASPEAKEIEPFLKENYKGNTYIPWATIERLVYQQDADAEFLIIKNANGGIVHTDTQENRQRNIQKDEVVSETSASMYSHMVIVALNFLGKTFIETYPIQDKDYTSLKIYDQNSVNKALQRAKAKVASRATGLGYKLYEGHDLQFDAPVVETKPDLTKGHGTNGAELSRDVEPTKPSTTKKATKKDDAPKVAVITAEQAGKEIAEDSQEIGTRVVLTDTEVDPKVMELYNLINDSDAEKMTGILQKLNVTVVKKYGFALNIGEDINKFNNKVTNFKDVEKFTNSIRNMLG